MAKNKTPFKVEDNYFDNLEKEILAKVNQETKKKYLFPKTKTIVRYAAALLLLLAIGGMLWWNQPSDLRSYSSQVSQTKTMDKVDSDLILEIEFTEEELEYLEYYLEMDVLNDYLTYNDVEL